MFRLLLLFGLIAGPAGLVAAPMELERNGPPLAVIGAKVELTVGRALSTVNAVYLVQYLPKDDPDHDAKLSLQCAIYVDKSLTDPADIANAAAAQLVVGRQSFTPDAVEIVPADRISDYPVPEDAAVALLRFDIPRTIAHVRFEATLNWIQPNFHYHGALLAAYTPWLPHMIVNTPIFAPDQHDFEVSLKPVTGVILKKYAIQSRLLRESADELVYLPMHRQTIAAEIQPAK